jgi:hypothetical protein
MKQSKSETVTFSEGDVRAEVRFRDSQFLYARFYVEKYERGAVQIDSPQQFRRLMAVLSAAQDVVAET